MSEPTKSGDKPITEDQITDDETTQALEAQAASEAEIAKAHEFTGEGMSREEYDRIGKGDDYEPKDWGPAARPDDRTFAGTETAVAGSPRARRQQGNVDSTREPQGKPRQIESSTSSKS